MTYRKRYRCIPPLVIGAALWASGPAQGLSIDNMVLISGQNPQGDYLTLKNDSEEGVLVKTELLSLTVGKDNETIETPIAEGTFAQWGISLAPQQFVLAPGEARQVTLKAQSNVERPRDEVYGIVFLPEPTQPQQSEGKQIDIQVGFKAHYIVPSKAGKMDYLASYDYEKGELTLTNRGTTLLQAKLDRCQAGVKEEPGKPCSASFLAIAGREKVYRVPAWLRGEEMAFEILNHDKRYRQPLVLTRQQPTQQGGDRG